jgi:RNA polymerase sigma factor (sigma-70 family)
MSSSNTPEKWNPDSLADKEQFYAALKDDKKARAVWEKLYAVIKQVFTCQSLPPEVREELWQQVTFEMWTKLSVKRIPFSGSGNCWDQIRRLATELMKHRTTDIVRKRKRERRFLSLADETSLDPADPGDGPVDGLISEESAGILRVAIEKLPEEYRLVLKAHYLNGLLCEEIAARLGIPIGTVKSRLHEGRRRLRDNPEVAALRS